MYGNEGSDAFIVSLVFGTAYEPCLSSFCYDGTAWNTGLVYSACLHLTIVLKMGVKGSVQHLPGMFLYRRLRPKQTGSQSILSTASSVQQTPTCFEVIHQPYGVLQLSRAVQVASRDKRGAITSQHFQAYEYNNLT
jgi:hypothetical protein